MGSFRWILVPLPFVALGLLVLTLSVFLGVPR